MGAPVAGDIDDIRARLDAIAEDLADLALARLRESIDAEQPELAHEERRLTRARRAVERATAILSDTADPE